MRMAFIFSINEGKVVLDVVYSVEAIKLYSQPNAIEAA